MTGRVLLVRHTAVARVWQGRCYGRSDVVLSRAGAQHLRALVEPLAQWGPDMIVHSGLQRAAALADAVARVTGIAPLVDTRWAERDFGNWEGRHWSAIYRATGNLMDGMLDAPDSFRPGGGETTAELARRAAAALGALRGARTLVVTHGGPLAAVRGLRLQLPPRCWAALIVPNGGQVELDPTQCDGPRPTLSSCGGTAVVSSGTS